MALTSSMDAPLAIEATGLVKAFGPVRAVEGIDLRVGVGEIYGILGPNGAGKTTLIRMLATLSRPDDGVARIFGYDTVADAAVVRDRIALTGQLASVDDELTGRENLVLLGRLLGYSRGAAEERAAALLGSFGLGDAANRLVRTYSGGMRRRLDIVASILVIPDLLFLDEPTTGLDPHSRNQVWEVVRTLAARGTTIVLTTQYLDEADQLAGRIAVIDRGRVIAEGTPGELKALTGSGTLAVRLRDAILRPEAVRRLEAVLGVPVHTGSDPVTLTARVAHAGRATDALAALASSGIEVAGFSLGQPSLDEVFLTLTGHPAGDDDTTTQEAAA